LVEKGLAIHREDKWDKLREQGSENDDRATCEVRSTLAMKAGR
jgi:hypothetical protein